MSEAYARFLASDRNYGTKRVWHELVSEGVPAGRIDPAMKPPAGSKRTAQTASGCLQTRMSARRGHRSQHAGPQLRGPGYQPQMDRQLHQHLDNEALVLSAGADQSVLPVGGRLVDERHDDRPARNQCPGDGDLAAGQASRPTTPLVPRQPVNQRAVPAADGRPWRHLFDEPLGQLLGQCGDGKLLLLAEAELTARNTYRTRDGAGADVLDSIKRLYNPKPRHSAISYVCQWTSS